MRAARMQGVMSGTAYPVLGPELVCSVRGCGRPALSVLNGMCEDCSAMMREFDEYWSETQRQKRKRYAARLRTFALLAVFVTLTSWLAIEICPRLWVAFKLWQMGSN